MLNNSDFYHGDVVPKNILMIEEGTKYPNYALIIPKLFIGSPKSPKKICPFKNISFESMCLHMKKLNNENIIYDDMVIGKANDIWSLALTLIELIMEQENNYIKSNQNRYFMDGTYIFYAGLTSEIECINQAKKINAKYISYKKIMNNIMFCKILKPEHEIPFNYVSDILDKDDIDDYVLYERKDYGSFYKYLFAGDGLQIAKNTGYLVNSSPKTVCSVHMDEYYKQALLPQMNTIMKTVYNVSEDDMEIIHLFIRSMLLPAKYRFTASKIETLIVQYLYSPLHTQEITKELIYDHLVDSYNNLG